MRLVLCQKQVSSLVAPSQWQPSATKCCPHLSNSSYPSAAIDRRGCAARHHAPPCNKRQGHKQGGERLSVSSQACCAARSLGIPEYSMGQQGHTSHSSSPTEGCYPRPSLTTSMQDVTHMPKWLHAVGTTTLQKNDSCRQLAAQRLTYHTVRFKACMW